MHDLANADRAAGVILVHGTVVFESVVIAHAWLEGDGKAYDAVAHVSMTVAQHVAERGFVQRSIPKNVDRKSLRSVA